MVPPVALRIAAPAACLVVLIHQSLPAAQTPSEEMFRGGPSHTGVSHAPLFSGQAGVLWRVATAGPVRSSPAVTASRVFVGSEDGNLYALDRRDGRIGWRYQAGSPVHASPAVAGGLVIAASMGGKVFATDEQSGRERWSFSTGPALPLNAKRAGLWDYFTGSPVVSGRTVVVGGQDGVVYAVDLTSGRRIWQFQTRGRVRGTPAISGGMVVIGSFDGRVYALDLASGAERWVHRTEGDTLDSDRWGWDRRAIQSSAALEGGSVLIGSRDGGLYALQASTGERKWRFTHRGSWVVGSPAVKDNRAYVGSSDGHFFQAVDIPSGQEVWRLATGTNVLSSPLLIGDVILVGTNAGDLLALEQASGKIRWQLRLGDAIMSSPTVRDGVIYVGSDDGGVYALGETNPRPVHLAVYFDSTLAPRALKPGARLGAEYFRSLGWKVLGADSLPGFLHQRAADGEPSVVVFALDDLPPSIGLSSDTTLLRRYLNAGGKAVWLSLPIGAVVRDSLGRVADQILERMELVTGVSGRSLDYSEHAAHPTEAGKRWGLSGFFRGNYPIDPAAVSEALGRDELGRSTVWVRIYRPDRPGSGFVQLWGMGVTPDRLEAIRAVAEYGLLRR